MLELKRTTYPRGRHFKWRLYLRRSSM